jgi:N-dimethylarginine dimethylaminohydrolase
VAILSSQNINGHSMTGELLTVLVCPPRNAGWDHAGKMAQWQELGYLHRPDVEIARQQHEELCLLLIHAGARVLCLPPDDSLSLDAVYVHDASFPTDYGVILMNPGKKNRVAEAVSHGSFYSGMGAPLLGSVCEPGTSEAGDMVWLDARTLLIGCGYRTNELGIAQIRSMLSSKGIEVISAPLPYGAGPSACLHLMSLMSMLDEQTVLVDLPWLAVETVELLKSRGLRLIEIDYSERESLACNVLSLGKERLVAIEENAQTNRRLRDAGFEVCTFRGSEICINGSGGPTCLTRPLLRNQA